MAQRGLALGDRAPVVASAALALARLVIDLGSGHGAFRRSRILTAGGGLVWILGLFLLKLFQPRTRRIGERDLALGLRRLGLAVGRGLALPLLLLMLLERLVHRHHTQLLILDVRIVVAVAGVLALGVLVGAREHVGAGLVFVVVAKAVVVLGVAGQRGLVGGVLSDVKQILRGALLMQGVDGGVFPLVEHGDVVRLVDGGLAQWVALVQVGVEVAARLAPVQRGDDLGGNAGLGGNLFVAGVVFVPVGDKRLHLALLLAVELDVHIGDAGLVVLVDRATVATFGHVTAWVGTALGIGLGALFADGTDRERADLTVGGPAVAALHFVDLGAGLLVVDAGQLDGLARPQELALQHQDRRAAVTGVENVLAALHAAPGHDFF